MAVHTLQRLLWALSTWWAVGCRAVSAGGEGLVLLQQHAREIPSGEAPPEKGGTVEAIDDTVLKTNAQDNNADVSHGRKKTSGDDDGDWCGYKAHEGWATLYTDKSDPMSYLVDITDMVKKSESGSALMLVTVMAAKGLYMDDYGQLVTLHEPLEETQNTIIELRPSDDGYSVDVLRPQQTLRTSDRQTEEAFEMGAPSQLWAGSLERLSCGGSGGGGDYYSGGGGDSYNLQRQKLRPNPTRNSDANLGRLSGDNEIGSRLQPLRDTGSSVDDRIVFDGIDLLAHGFFVAPSIIGGVSDYRLVAMKSFKSNFDITVELRYEVETAAFPLTITFSVTQLPEMPMAPRPGDERLGYFTSDYVDLGKHKEEPDHLRSEAADTKVSMIWRYDTDKLPKKQIKIFIDPTVPKRYRQCFREGIDAWNEAFHQAGGAGHAPSIKGVAPEDADWPEDYDAGDARFSTISWSIDVESVYSEGIAKVDPRSGEILKSDIIMTTGWIHAWMGELDGLTPRHRTEHLHRGYRREEWTASRVRPGRSNSSTRLHKGGRSYSDLLAIAKVLSASVPMSRKDEEEVLCDGLRDVVMHETGHILGLRHNFKGSMGVSWECVQDIACSEKNGLTISVMDYLPTNVPSQGVQGVHLFTPKLGGYDIEAIKYGYTNTEDQPSGTVPILTEKLQQILTAAEQYPVCSDGEIESLDPTCAMYDMSSEPVQYYIDQLKLIRSSQHNLLNSAVAPGASYAHFGDAALRLLGKAAWIGERLIGYIGGENVTHSHRQWNGEHGGSAVKSIPGPMQRSALNTILRILRPYTDNLVPQKHQHHFLVQSGEWEGANGLDLQKIVREVQTTLLEGLLDAERIQRLPMNAPEGDATGPLTSGEFISKISSSVFGEDGNLFDDPRDWHLQMSYVSGLQTLYSATRADSVGAATQAFYAITEAKQAVVAHMGEQNAQKPTFTGKAGQTPGATDMETAFLWQLRGLLEDPPAPPPVVVQPAEGVSLE